jgi:hypothetical protein
LALFLLGGVSLAAYSGPLVLGLIASYMCCCNKNSNKIRSSG